MAANLRGHTPSLDYTAHTMWPTDPTEQEKLARGLVAGRAEHQRVDLKSTLLLDPKSAVVEMVRDISAIANTDEDFGYIVIGAVRGKVIGNVESLSEAHGEGTSEKLTQVAHNYLDPVPRFRLVTFHDPDPTIGRWGIVVIEPSTDQPYMFVRAFSDDKGKVVLRSGDWYVRRGDTTDLALPRDWARVLERRVRRALQPVELEVQSLRERVAVLEARSVPEPARLRVSLVGAPSWHKQWPFKIAIVNPGTVGVEDLHIRASLPEHVELERHERKAERVGMEHIAAALVRHREDEDLDEERRLVSGVVGLIRPGERRAWGTGYASFPAPGEYEVRVTIKARNLPKPLDEALKVTVAM